MIRINSRLSSFFFIFAFLPAVLLSPSTLTAAESQAVVKDPASVPPVLDLTLRPIVDAGGKISHVEVALDMLPAAGAKAASIGLKAAVKYTDITGIADRIENLQVTDDQGPLDLKKLDDISAYGGMVIWRKWQSVRPAVGTVKVSYRARVPEFVPHPGPPFDLRLSGGGVSGAGCGFMALPEWEGPMTLRLHWDLKNLEPGSSGRSTIGDGDFEAIGTIEQVFQSFYITGPLGRFPEQGTVDGFSTAWLGTPDFDVRKLMAEAARSYSTLRSFFRDTVTPSYRFFMTVRADNFGVGGSALQDSFLLYIPEKAEYAKRARGTITHEMTHKWTGGMAGPAGETFWFSEGLTVYYTRLVMYRAGLFSADEYIEDANDTVSSYLTNPLRNLPNDQIEKHFWSDRNAQVIPYDRGSLYFAQVDAQIRAASGGKRSLDDVIRELFAKRDEDDNLTREMWLEALKKEIGPQALAEFESVIIKGGDLNLDAAAFGPEFTKVPAVFRKFELGFDEKALLAPAEKRISGLVGGSAAEQAGLKNGDLVLDPVDLLELKKNDRLLLRTRVQRGDQTLDIEYLPRGNPVPGFKWIPLPPAPFKPVITRHQGVFNGRNISYTAEVAETVIGDEKKPPSARIVSVSYLAEGQPEPASRPVVFVFNGGPIVASAALHLAAFGPKRVNFPEDLNADPSKFDLVDNSYTVLDAADLVFFDPAGTGFSRVNDGTAPNAYASVDADARELAEFVEAWSRKHNCLDSPKFLFGESYGALRAAVAAQKINKLDPPVRLDGVYLMGQALNIIETCSRPANILSPVVTLPTVATLGWYHGRVRKNGRTFEEFLDEVRQFARTEFLTALFQGNTLPAAERDRLSVRLEELTGLPAKLFADSNLRTGKYAVRTELFKDRGVVTGTNDGRYLGPAPQPGKQADDPSNRIGIAVTNGFKKYFEEDLHLDVKNYAPASTAAGMEGWDWGGASPFGDWPYMAPLAEVMTENKGFRVAVGIGYHDLLTTLGAAEFAVSQSGWPKERVSVFRYDGGHMAYTVEKSLKQLMDDVRTWISDNK